MKCLVMSESIPTIRHHLMASINRLLIPPKYTNKVCNCIEVATERLFYFCYAICTLVSVLLWDENNDLRTAYLIL